jgi:uncharacterized membrane protein HdeD (DUF308 family)
MTVKTVPGRKMLMFAGGAMCLFGVLLLVSPAAVGAAVVKLVALVLIVTGLAQLIQAFRAGGRLNTVVSAALGLIVAGLGVMVAMNPELGSGFLTALLMIFFLIHGAWKVSTAWRYRRVRGWAGLMAAGALSLLFVYLLWAQWPLSGAWAIGVLVGADLLLTGIAMLVLGFAMKRVRTSGYLDTINL